MNVLVVGLQDFFVRFQDKKSNKIPYIAKLFSIISHTHSYCLSYYMTQKQLDYKAKITLSVPDDYPLVLGCEEHVSSLGIFVA